MRKNKFIKILVKFSFFIIAHHSFNYSLGTRRHSYEWEEEKNEIIKSVFLYIFNENETICFFPSFSLASHPFSRSANKWEKISNMTHKILTLFASISEKKRLESKWRGRKKVSSNCWCSVTDWLIACTIINEGNLQASELFLKKIIILEKKTFFFNPNLVFVRSPDHWRYNIIIYANHSAIKSLSLSNSGWWWWWKVNELKQARERDINAG